MKGIFALIAVAALYGVVELATHALVPGALAGLRSIVAPAPAPPPLRVRATNALLREVEQGELWVGRPHIYSQSRRALESHFVALSPMVPHPAMEPVFPILSPYQLAKRGSLYAGRKVTLAGVVKYLTVSGVAAKRSAFGKLLIYLAQIGIPKRDDPLVYCRFVAPATAQLKAGDQVVAVGVPIAEGAIKLSRGGFAEGAFLAGAMVGPYRTPKEVVDAARSEAGGP